MVLHADNDGPIKGATMLATLQKLGVVSLFTRPSVSTARGGAVPHCQVRAGVSGRSVCRPGGRVPMGGAFRGLVQHRYRHSDIRFVMPQQWHAGQGAALLAARAQGCEAAKAGHPDRRCGQAHWQCCACHHQAVLRAGAVRVHPRLPLTMWRPALYWLAHTKTNLAAPELTRHLGVCYHIAWGLRHELMQVMQGGEASRCLGCLSIQIDDAYLGKGHNGGKPGLGSENERHFAITVSTNVAVHPGMAVVESVSGFTKKAMSDLSAQHLDPARRFVAAGWVRPGRPLTRIVRIPSSTLAMGARRLKPRAHVGSRPCWAMLSDRRMEPIMRLAS